MMFVFGLIFFGPILFIPIMKYFIVSLVYFINFKIKYIDISEMYSFKCLCKKLYLFEILSLFIYIFIISLLFSMFFSDNECNVNCIFENKFYFVKIYEILEKIFMMAYFGRLFGFQLIIYVFVIMITYILYLFDSKNIIIAHSKRTTWIIFVLWFLIGIIGIAFFQVFLSIGGPFLESIYYKSH